MEEVVVVLVCLGINGLLAAAEMAFVTVTKPRLRQLRKNGDKNATIILQLRENPERTLSVIQIGITLVGALGAAVGGVGVHESLTPWLVETYKVPNLTAEVISIVAVIIPFTLLNVVWGELVPKSLAIRSPHKIALASARWLTWADQIFSPIVTFLEWSTKKVLQLVFKKSKVDIAHQTVESVDLDLLSNQARQYVLNLMTIEKEKVHDIFLPWENVDSVDHETSMSDVEEVIFRSGHTRLPVMYNGAIFGIINTKEVLSLRKAGEEDWHKIIRPISKVDENDSLLKALLQMQEKRSHLSAVYAGAELLGIVTMEDIIEEVIGEVYDEDDDGNLRRIIKTTSKLRSKNKT